MTNSPLIDRKIEEAYGIIRETSEKKKRQSRKRKFVQTGAAAAAIVVAIGFCAANPEAIVSSKYKAIILVSWAKRRFSIRRLTTSGFTRPV